MLGREKGSVCASASNQHCLRNSCHWDKHRRQFRMVGSRMKESMCHKGSLDM